MAPADNWEAFQKLSGHRLVDSFGCLRGVVIPDELDEPIEERISKKCSTGGWARVQPAGTRQVKAGPVLGPREKPMYERSYSNDDFRMAAAAYNTQKRLDRARSRRLDGL